MRVTTPKPPPYRIVFGREVHPTHHWAAADDILECADCCVRPYNPEAKQSCPERGTHGPDLADDAEEAELDRLMKIQESKDYEGDLAFHRRWG